MSEIAQNIQQLTRALTETAAAAGRPAPRLLAVSKTRSAAEIRVAYQAGQTAFGENYVSEAVDKIEALSDLPLEWHFIGPLQSNKTRAVAGRFDWVQSLDRLRVAERLASQRPPARGPLNVLVQVNIDREPQKAGVLPDAVPALLDQIRSLDGLAVRGLMCIPRADGDGTAFSRMATLFDTLRAQQDGGWDTLSMGMSADYVEAIHAGATMIRLGTAIFGPRRPAHDQ